MQTFISCVIVVVTVVALGFAGAGLVSLLHHFFAQ